MTIEKIEIGKSVEALHEWHKLSLTVSILPGEDPQLIHKEAKELLDKLLPGIDGQPPKDAEQPIDKRIAVIIQDIMDCQVIDEKNGIGVQVGLLGFEKMCSTHPELKNAYDSRLKQLQNA